MLANADRRAYTRNISVFYSLVSIVAKAKELKRENFDVSPEQQAALETLQALLDAPSKKDAMLFAVNLTLHLAVEARKGNQIFVGDPAKDDLTRVIMLGIEKPTMAKWLYLVAQAHPWKKQLFVKGRKLPAAAVWTGMLANNLSVQQAAENWELPVDAVQEILEYCQTNKVLLEMEAQEELRILEEKGIGIVAKNSRR